MHIETMSEAIETYDLWLDEIHPETPFGIPASKILFEWIESEGIDSDDLEDDADLP